MSPGLPLLRPSMSTLHLFLPQGMRLPTASVPAGVRLHHHAGGKDLSAQLAGLDGEGHVLLVLPARRAARGALSGAVSRGRAVGLLFSDDAEWVRAYLAAGAGTPPGRIERAVLAQWQDEYLDSGRYWLRRLRDLPDARALNWMGDRVGADTVCRRMASGARMCAYFGHGHPEGLSGYHGLYYPEVLQHAVRRPVESFVSFSCRQLAQPANRPCFGRVMVEQHRVRAFWERSIMCPRHRTAFLPAWVPTCWDVQGYEPSVTGWSPWTMASSAPATLHCAGPGVTTACSGTRVRRFEHLPAGTPGLPPFGLILVQRYLPRQQFTQETRSVLLVAEVQVGLHTEGAGCHLVVDQGYFLRT